MKKVPTIKRNCVYGGGGGGGRGEKLHIKSEKRRVDERGGGREKETDTSF